MVRENRVIIAGSREFSDYVIAEKAITEALGSIRAAGPVRIVSGHCRGADLLGERYASEHGLGLSLFPADWNRYGRRAGFVRNSEMAQYAAGEGAIGGLIAFWDGKSRGTKMMIDIARKKDIRVHVFDLSGRAYE